MYPAVIGEFETVRELTKGKSIARFGDGELKILDGKEYVREERNAALTAELRAMVAAPHADCLIGIPTMDPAGPKYANWWCHAKRFCKYFHSRTGQQYYSSLITRPDSAPWIECRTYVELLTALWCQAARIAVVCERSSKLLPCIRQTDAVVKHIECPSHGAYAWIDDFERRVAQARPGIALLSCGPTASCLANRLASRGIQAVDMGSVGGFLLRWLRGDCKPESYAEERANA